ncbi:hypothetical protein EI16_05165 [Hydrogenovibrio marinus]|uniref:Uncharacterized protein n=1 Tax=Hydrogenovibrio marinus TaxID=28885 RepID=A0A066ZTW7_HYDMR|nr:hypothetical protein EI16_05165 [Hydrogenovibrio marinus]
MVCWVCKMSCTPSNNSGSQTANVHQTWYQKNPNTVIKSVKTTEKMTNASCIVLISVPPFIIFYTHSKWAKQNRLVFLADIFERWEIVMAGGRPSPQPGSF